MVAINNTPKLLADITERAVLTYLESFLGLLLAAGTTNVITVSALESAGIAAIPAGLAVVKGAVGSLLGRPGTASWLPAKSDPASTTIS
ncbi:hypothetical protein [Streptomyces sp. NBC_00829]|uniref:hypothetical protein n=1 Tax=Streptomyces sp. NBC_00829 TaxID=2903679 RepID=UPI0038674219|nr:hypothetical protein OG293_15615 [Streptomyces sp. NBC_00829]